MNGIVVSVWKRIVRIFITGVIAILPVVVTIAIVIWVANFVKGYLGPDTAMGGALSGLGGSFLRDSFAPYAMGWIMVLGVVFAVGVFAEFGAKALLQRLTDSVFRRIPLVGSIYSTTKQFADMLGQKKEDALKGMAAVYYFFGDDEMSTGVLAFLASPERLLIDGKEFHIVIIPTAPLPFGGALLYVPADRVKSADMSVDGLMSIYLSMGVSAPNYMDVLGQDKNIVPAEVDQLQPKPGE